MREIKFRGWHTVKKVMFSAQEMANDQLTLLPTGEFINVSGASTRLSEIFPRDKFVPLQYTGLRDKNGKEIYEGDIVNLYHYTDDYHECLARNDSYSPQVIRWMFSMSIPHWALTDTKIWGDGICRWL